jgi:hypothetical protein
MELSGWLHAPTAISRRKEPRYPLARRLGGSQSRSGRGADEKESSLPGIQPGYVKKIDVLRIILEITASGFFYSVQLL